MFLTFLTIHLLTFGQLTYSQTCPLLEGRWTCKYRSVNEQPFEVDVAQQSTADGYVQYTVTTPVEGTTDITTDGQERQVNPKIGKGSVRSTCVGGKVESKYSLNPDQPVVFADQMYAERGGLVRIFRQVSPPPKRNETTVSFSCRPLIPRRRS